MPGAFPVDMRLRAVDEARRQAEVIRQRAEAGYANAGPTALEQPPGEILYHGSRNAERVRMEGLFASPEDEICEGDDEYGWERCWK